jgi:hypothetical protein
MPPAACAFCAPVALPRPAADARARSSHSDRPAARPGRRGRGPRAALLAVEVAALGGGADEHAAARLGAASAYLLYVGEGSRLDVLRTVSEAGMPEGDAVSAAGGLYQRRFESPDPLWKRSMCGSWDPKPTRWVMSDCFEGRLAERAAPAGGGDADGMGELVFDVTGEGERAIALRDEVEARMVELGVDGSVGLRGGSGEGGCLVVRPAGAPLGGVVHFCASMLRVSGDGVCAFGGRPFVDACLELCDGAVGILARGDGGGAADARLFVSSETGAAALFDGAAHYGVLDASPAAGTQPLEA